MCIRDREDIGLHVEIADAGFQEQHEHGEGEETLGCAAQCEPRAARRDGLGFRGRWIGGCRCFHAAHAVIVRHGWSAPSPMGRGVG